MLKAKAKGGALSSGKDAAPAKSARDDGVPKEKIGGPGSGPSGARALSGSGPKGVAAQGPKGSPLFKSRATDPKGIAVTAPGSASVPKAAADSKGSASGAPDEAAPLPPPPAEAFSHDITGVELPPLGGEARPMLSPVGAGDGGLPVMVVTEGEDEDGDEEATEEPTREVSPSVPPVPGLAIPALSVASALPVAGGAAPKAPAPGAQPPAHATPAPSAPASSSLPPPPPVPPVPSAAGAPLAGGSKAASGATPFDDLQVELTEPVDREGGSGRKRLWLYGGIAGGAVMLLVILILVFSGSGKKGDGSKPGEKTASSQGAGDERPSRPSEDAAAKAAAPDAATSPRAASPDAAIPARPSGPDGAAPARAGAPDAAAPSKVKLTVNVEPADASPTIVFRGKEHRGRLLELEGLEASGKPDVVRVMAPGYETVSINVTLDRSVQRTVTLKPRDRARPMDPERREVRRRPPRVRPRTMLIDLD
ncbi:MAG: hypothetical protein RBU30_02755 [Polyangia bacterium]|nr:hypothetical protein [Polyangia bacterium]